MLNNDDCPPSGLINDQVADLYERAGVMAAAGDTMAAIALYRRVLEKQPELDAAHRHLAVLLLQAGQTWESLDLWADRGHAASGTPPRIDAALSRTLCTGDLHLAGELARVAAVLALGSRWYPPVGAEAAWTPPKIDGRVVSVAKLLHDAEQFEYLRRLGRLGDDFKAIIRNYRIVADRMTEVGRTRAALVDPMVREVGEEYGRLVHVRASPRVTRALGDWDPSIVESQLLSKRPPIAVIDGFLSQAALDGLRAFCWESTIWHENRYMDDRLAAFFSTGFSCPLLIQIAVELQDRLRVVRRHHLLQQLWAFKYPMRLRASDSLHADFAAVNVNFWITPDEANAADPGGGLTVYDAEAPSSWDFHSYNENTALIRDHLARLGCEPTEVGHRANRAVIFESDLFHATSDLDFHAGYLNRRISVTMLFGDRRDRRVSSRVTSAPRIGAGPSPILAGR